MDPLLSALQASSFATAMRGSVFLYPLANVVHVLAALIFFAAVASMDVKVLGAIAIDDARKFIGRVRLIAGVAFTVQVISGVMLLAPEATHIWHNPVFKVKLGAIALGLANVVLLEVLVRRAGGAVTGALRASAVASLILWLSTATLGRLIAYF